MTAPAVHPVRRALEPTKWISRAVIILATMLAFVSLRIDRFVRIAGETDWVPGDVRTDRAGSGLADYCLRNACPRLPESQIPIAIGLGLAATALVLIALWNARAYLVKRSKEQFMRDAGRAVRRRVAPPEIPNGSPNALLWVLWGGIFALGIVVAVVRGIVAYGRPGALLGISQDAVTSATVTLFAVLQFVTVLVALGVLARLVATQARGVVSWRGVSKAFADQRATIVMVAFFAAFVLFLPLTSDQVADALRALDISERNNGGAGILFMIGTACLLSAAALETWRAIDRANARRGAESIRQVVRWWVWLGLGVLIFALGAWGQSQSVIGGGLQVIGVVFVVFGLLEIGPRKTAATYESNLANVVRIGDRRLLSNVAMPTNVPAASTATPMAPQMQGPQGPAVARAVRRVRRYRESPAARYVAAIPLAALAVATSGAAAESAITGGLGTQSVFAFLTAAVLGGIAVYITRTLKRQTEENNDLVSKCVTPMLLVGAILLLWLTGFHPVGVFFAGLVTAIALGFHLWVIGRRERDRDAASSYWSVVLAIAVAFAVTIGLHLAPISVAGSLGTVTLVLVFVGGLLGIGFVLSRISVAFTAPRALEWFNIKHLPVFTMLLIVWVSAGFVLPANLHEVRVVDGGRTVAVPTTMQSAFRTWMKTQPEFREGTEDSGRDVVPLVLVASHGGGIRAAYWTGVVLDCIVGASVPDLETTKTLYGTDCVSDRREGPNSLGAARRVFIASGVSGGAVGLAAYSEQLLSGGLEPDWIGERLSDDLLAPVIGWALFHDFPNHLLGLRGGGCDGVDAGGACVLQDRAAVLEQAIDVSVTNEDGEPIGDSMLLRSTWEARVAAARAATLNIESAVPLLVFNSSTTSEPVRAITSAANLANWPAPQSQLGDPQGVADRPVVDASETLDMLCVEQDMRISTAATLAARFPYVSPSGLLNGNCDPKDSDPKVEDVQRCRTTDTCELQLADGGYLENSGLMTIAEILPSLQSLVAKHNNANPEHRIAIVVVDIDNDYREIDPTPAKPATAGETFLPAQIILSGPGAMEGAAYGLVRQRVPGACFISLAPARQPGIQAPLGWSLSDSSRANLRESLVAEPNQALQVQNLQFWLEPEFGDQGVGQREVAGQRAETVLESCVPARGPATPSSAAAP